MSETQFPQYIVDALDRLSAPPLPDGFIDRLVARVENQSEAPLPEMRPRRALGGRWRRTGIIAGSIGLFGMVSAAAAATGIFGQPLYVPVVSEALAKANIVPMPKVAVAKPPKAKPIIAAKATPPKVDKQPEQQAEPEIPDGTEQARSAIRSMWRDPGFRQLPPEQRRLAARERLRAGISGGLYSKDELKSAMQQMQAERTERREQRAAARAAFGLPEKPKQRSQAVSGEANAPQPPLLLPEARQKLRERLQNATPEERERILAKMRERREARKATRAAKEAEASPETVDIAEPPK